MAEGGHTGQELTDRVQIRFDLRNVALATGVVILVFLVFEFLRAIQGVLVLFLLSIILATAIEPIVRRLRRFGFARGYGVLLVYLVLVSAVVIFLAFVAQVVIQELAALLASSGVLTRRLAIMIGELPPGPLQDIARSILTNTGLAITSSGVGPLLSSGALSGIAVATLTFVEWIFGAVTILVIAYFWIAEQETVRRLVLQLVSPAKRDRARVIWETVEEQLGAWARGQLILMVTVGCIQGVGFAAMGLPFAVLLGVFAGIAEVIPLVGPYIGAAPALIVALSQSPQLALVVALYSVVVNLIESNILIPRIMQQSVGVSPLLVILALLAGSAAYGVIGALLAVPIVAAIQATLNEVAAGRPMSVEERHAQS